MKKVISYNGEGISKDIKMRKQRKNMILSIVRKMIDIVEILCDKKENILAKDVFNILMDLYDVIGTVEYVLFNSNETYAIALKCIKEKIKNILESINDKKVTLRTEDCIEELLDKLKVTQIELDNKIVCKKEILFMPYQVSMWDSMESIWLAASQDKDVESVVMPIPYYDVINGNIQGALHYEGNQYPPYVPVVHYQDYDLEERMPDVIFIHNPYDQYNAVTRIPEEFYSSNIKKYTQNLVYVPYYVTESDGPSNLSCIMPGVLYADYVVVQPGHVYEKFCRMYTQYIIKEGIQDKFSSAQKKFLPLGSPKFDKILNTQVKIRDLPEEWREKIFKDDGSMKKIIFYNTTIASFLQNTDEMIKKIDSVFAAFSRNKDKVVLLWRPHPLLLKTINSMRPNYKEAYLKRIYFFKEQDWGILDETADPDLAMAVSDAYYGDISSLTTVYKATGKPILIQNIFMYYDN